MAAVSVLVRSTTALNALLPLAFAAAMAAVRPSGTLDAAAARPPDAPWPGAAVYNLKVVSDASPDLSDLDSLIYSTTSRWPSQREKVWALYYWSHILKRQTAPMVLHGFEVTDPIRNLTSFGFTMCSTVSGMNQSLYEALGAPHQYWDLCNHTVAAVEYDGAFHMVDSSMSNLVTTDDGTTLASVPEAAADSARLVRERSLYSSSPNGFLSGSDVMRPLPDAVSPADGSVVLGFSRAFCADGLKYRDYYYNWDAGHRYVLNLRGGESYTRYHRRLGTSREYWVGSERIASPDPAQTFEIEANDRFSMRGNGRWTFTPPLSTDAWVPAAYRSSNVVSSGFALNPADPSRPAEVVYKVQGADAIASQTIRARFVRSAAAATAAIAVSLNHGRTWTEIAALGTDVGSAVPLTVTARDEVNGFYETLVRIEMRGGGSADGIALTDLTIETLTQVNAKALPKLTLGRNTIAVTAGDQSDTMVLWPDLRGDLWKKDAYDAGNIATQPVSVPRKFTAVAYPAVLTEDAYLTYRMDASAAITRAVYGGRLHNFRPGSYIDFLHSFDGGSTWIHSYRLSDVNKPYDVVHYETVTDVPPGVTSIQFKYRIHNTNPDAGRASGLYGVRMEVNHRPTVAGLPPLDVTWRWKEVQADRTLVDRTHRQRITSLPAQYVVNVGGVDHPVMDSISTSLADDADMTPWGYGDGIDPGGSKYIPIKRTDGVNHAKNRPYRFSRPPSGFQYSADASNTTILTDGVVGAPVTGGMSYWWGQCWSANQDVDLLVDLGQLRGVSAFRAHLFGYPFWDGLKGQVQDRVEVQFSTDGVNFTSAGVLQTALWRKDIPVNYMLLDNETATAWNFERRIASPASARYVRYRVTPKRILCASELQVLDRVSDEPFDLRIALPSAGSVPTAPPPAAPIDEIVLYAAAQAQVAGGWTVTADSTAAGGARLQNPNAGAAKLTTALAAPSQAFEITFNADAGKAYRVWVRGRALADAYTNDSVFLQFDGSTDAAGTPTWRIGTTSATPVVLEECSGCGVQGWGWADNGYGVDVSGPLVYFAASGPQRLRVQVREDGLGIDQVVLSAVKYATARPGTTKNDTTILRR